MQKYLASNKVKHKNQENLPTMKKEINQPWYYTGDSKQGKDDNYYNLQLSKML